METETFPEYIQSLTALREEYKNDIDIKIGIETEYYPALFADLLDLIRANGGIDYMILGQHFLDNEYDTRLYNGNATTDESRLAHYTAQVLEGLRTGCFSYIAHPDLIRYEGDLAIYRRHILPFCEEVKKLGYPLEINFLGLMDSRHYPREDFFRIAAEVGNDVIFGMDAHSPGAMLRKDVLEKAHDFCDRLGLHIVENVTLRRPV